MERNFVSTIFALSMILGALAQAQKQRVGKWYSVSERGLKLVTYYNAEPYQDRNRSQVLTNVDLAQSQRTCLLSDCTFRVVNNVTESGGTSDRTITVVTGISTETVRVVKGISSSSSSSNISVETVDLKVLGGFFPIDSQRVTIPGTSRATPSFTTLRFPDVFTYSSTPIRALAFVYPGLLRDQRPLAVDIIDNVDADGYVNGRSDRIPATVKNMFGREVYASAEIECQNRNHYGVADYSIVTAPKNSTVSLINWSAYNDAPEAPLKVEADSSDSHSRVYESITCIESLPDHLNTKLAFAPKLTNRGVGSNLTDIWMWALFDNLFETEALQVQFATASGQYLKTLDSKDVSRESLGGDKLSMSFVIPRELQGFAAIGDLTVTVFNLNRGGRTNPLMVPPVVAGNRLGFLNSEERQALEERMSAFPRAYDTTAAQKAWVQLESLRATRQAQNEK